MYFIPYTENNTPTCFIMFENYDIALKNPICFEFEQLNSAILCFKLFSFEFAGSNLLNSTQIYFLQAGQLILSPSRLWT